MKKNVSVRVCSVLLLFSATAMTTACIPVIPIVPSHSSSIQTEITVNEVAAKVAYAAQKYGSTKSAEDLLNAGKADLSTGQATIGDLEYLENLAFAGLMPSKKGARNFQASTSKVASTRIAGAASGSAKYKALQWLESYGLFVPSNGLNHDCGRALDSALMKRWLDRIHAYMGTSKNDDFFTTVNHDYLYENPDIAYAQPNASVYDSNLISDHRVVEWVKGRLPVEPSSNAFYETFIDTSWRTGGYIGGLVDDINSLLNASDIGGFIGELKKLAKNNGYCPLWDELALEYKPQVNLKEVTTYRLKATSYDLDALPSEIKKGSAGYNDSVKRFTPIFQENLGVSEEKANTYATYYTDFKYEFAKNFNYEYGLESGVLVPKEGTVYGDPTKGLNLYSFFNDIGFEHPDWFVFENSGKAKSLLSMFSDDHLNELKGWAVWQMLENYIPFLPDGKATMAWAHPSSENIHHDKETLSSDDFFSSYVIDYIAGNISENYVVTNEFKEDVATVRSLIGEIVSTFKKRVSSADWLSQDGKDKVSKKLDALVSLVGGDMDGSVAHYIAPEFVSKANGGNGYRNANIHDKANLQSLAEIVGTSWDEMDRKRETELVFAEYGPLLANALYIPWTNGFVISLGYMAAYKRPTQMTQEELLASYGWVVGHEISHGFDSSGILYDDSGKHYGMGWLDYEDQSTFKQRTSWVADYYSGVEVMPGQITNGVTVLGEAIADLTGLRNACDIGKTKNNFDFAKFFTVAAENFGAYASQALYLAKLASDAHPFGRARVNTALAAMTEFQKAFSIQEGDSMYMPETYSPLVW